MEPAPELELDAEETDMLAGGRGRGAASAMEIVCALARIGGARSLARISSAHVSGVSYRNIGEAGLHFLRTMADGSCRAAVRATVNPGGADLEAWREMGAPASFVEKQREIVRVLEDLGLEPSLTCAPYHCGNRPSRGDKIAWSESSAVSWANSVAGARTQREGGPSALAAAITGRTAPCGEILETNRAPGLVIEVTANLSDRSDFGALGLIAGKAAAGRVPWFRAQGSRTPGEDDLRALAAAMAASGSVAMFHFEGATPEALEGPGPAQGIQVVRVGDLSEGKSWPGTEPCGAVDLVALGCPHASLAQIGDIAGMCAGMRFCAKLWVMTSRFVARQAEEMGFGEAIRGAGGSIVCDTCIVVAPLKEMGFSSVATDSGKAAAYLKSHQGVRAHFGGIDRCLRAAQTGQFNRSLVVDTRPGMV